VIPSCYRDPSEVRTLEEFMETGLENRQLAHYFPVEVLDPKPGSGSNNCPEMRLWHSGQTHPGSFFATNQRDLADHEAWALRATVPFPPVASVRRILTRLNPPKVVDPAFDGPVRLATSTLGATS
jgi:hypothetical protein